MMDAPAPRIDFGIVHILGAQHAVANYLSTIEDGEPPTGVVDDFPNINLIKHIPNDQWKRALRSRHFKVMGNTLYWLRTNDFFSLRPTF